MSATLPSGAVRASAPRPDHRGPWLLFALGGIAVHAMLLGGVLSSWPAAVRVLLAGFVLLMVPGFAFVRLGLLPPGGGVLAAGWALGFGIAWNAILVLAARLAGHPVHGLEQWTLLASISLWAAALIVRPRRQGAPVPAGGGPEVHPLRLGRSATALILLATCAAALYVGRLGPVDTYPSDSPDHVGTIRRIATSGDAFPTDAYFRDAGRDGVDPRKGAWHPQVAIVVRLARVDAYEAWRWLPVLIAPMFVINIAALGLLAGGAAGAAIAAWVLLLTYGGTIDQTPLRMAVVSARLAEQVALAATVAVLADLAWPSLRWRVAAVLLGFAAVTTHLFAVVHLAVPLAALGIALLVRDRGAGTDFRRLLGTSLALAVVALPYVFWRTQQAYAPHNEIHTAPQGLLYLAGNWRIMSPGFLWTTFSWCWVLVPLLWLPLWKWGRREPAALWMLAATVAAALMTLNPLFVAVIEPRVGYLIPRFLWFVPVAAMMAWALPRLWRLAVAGPGRGRAVLALAAVAVTLVPAVRDAVALAPHPERTERAEAPYHALRWRDALDWMRVHLPEGTVVLADPVTSYSIPMMAGRYVVTLVDQHSSPNDPHALERILDARDALDAYSNVERLREVVTRYGVGAIALNNRFEEPPHLDYWGPQPGWFATARARLDLHPEAFENVFDTGDFVIYLVHGGALDAIDVRPPARSCIEPWRESEYPAGRRMEPGMPLLHAVRFRNGLLAPGDTLNAVALWRAPEPLQPGSYSVAVRLDRPLPDRFTPPRFVGKPWRKLLEKVRGERYRIRSNHLPTGGAYGVDRWQPAEVVRDSFQVVIPLDALPGDYTLGLRMVRQPHYPNYHLSDYFFDDDLFSGVPSGTVRIAAREDAHVRD